MAANKFLSDRESDTVAEFIRLIAEADRYGDGAAANMPFRQETSWKARKQRPSWRAMTGKRMAPTYPPGLPQD